MTRRLLATLLLLLPLGAMAETISRVEKLGNDTYRMEIDGKRHVALSEGDYNKVMQALADNVELRKQLATTTAKLEEYRLLTSDYEALRQKYQELTSQYKAFSDDSLQLNARYAETADKLVALNRDYSTLAHNYDDLTEKYRTIALRSRPRQMLDIGLGAVRANDTTSGVVLVGAGAELLKLNLRGWLFGGPDSYGVIVGSSF